MHHTYELAIEKLNAMIPELYAKPGQPRKKFSLDEIRLLLEAMGNPQKQFKSVLIAGTNGKGSTAATLASILTASGVKTGLYTSPHLERPNERIRIGQDEISDKVFADSFFYALHCAECMVAAGELTHIPSYFEILTAQAFRAFAEAEVEIAVVEVGLGGRLDATNVLDPLLSVITDISLDHMEWLGSTLCAIAREKAGIMRSKKALVRLPQHPEVDQALGEVAVELGVRGVSAVSYVPGSSEVSPYTVEALGSAIEVNSSLRGRHQQRNVALAIAAAIELAEEYGVPVTSRSLECGIRQTRWPGRMEEIRACGVEWILDVAHNPAGVLALCAGLRSFTAKTLVFGCLQDKPLAEMGRILFPLFERVICAPIRSPRATPMEELLAAVQAAGVQAVAAVSVGDALDKAAACSHGGSVVVSGSVYLVGEARRILTGGEGGKE